MRLVIALLLAVAFTSAARAETWIVVCEENFPPYNFIKDQVKTGIDTEIVLAVLNEIGVQADHQVYPWNRVVHMVDTGEADFAYQFVGTPERMAKYELVGPFRTGKTVFVTPAGRNLNYNTLEDLKGLTVGIVQGFSYSQEFDSATGFTKVASATNNQTLVRMVAAGRSDAAIGDYNTLRYLAQQEGVADKIAFLPKPHKEVPRYIAFPKSKADKAERFRAGLNKLVADGTVAAILKKWE